MNYHCFVVQLLTHGLLRMSQTYSNYKICNTMCLMRKCTVRLREIKYIGTSLAVALPAISKEQQKKSSDLT